MKRTALRLRGRSMLEKTPMMLLFVSLLAAAEETPEQQDAAKNTEVILHLHLRTPAAAQPLAEKTGWALSCGYGGLEEITVVTDVAAMKALGFATQVDCHTVSLSESMHFADASNIGGHSGPSAGSRSCRARLLSEDIAIPPHLSPWLSAITEEHDEKVFAYDDSTPSACLPETVPGATLARCELAPSLQEAMACIEGTAPPAGTRLARYRQIMDREIPKHDDWQRPAEPLRQLSAAEARGLRERFEADALQEADFALLSEAGGVAWYSESATSRQLQGVTRGLLALPE